MLPLGRLVSQFKNQKNLHFVFTFTFSTTTNHHDGVKLSPPSPPPIRVSLTELAGRGVFATRRIGAGDLIHTAKPLVSHPSLSAIHSVCYFCLRKLAMATDSQAQSVPFCSEQCGEQAKVFYEVERKADWSAYDDYCRTRGLKYPLLVRRLACMVISGVASSDCLDILQPARLSDYMILEMEEEFGLLRSAFTKANIMDGQMACILRVAKIHPYFFHLTSFPLCFHYALLSLEEHLSLTLIVLTKQWYTSVLARIRINAFRIELPGGLYEDLLKSAAASVEAEVAVGNAVYMLPSFYNHDCDPNVHIIWIENTNARLKALRDIEAGEELRICYIDASMDRDARQTLLSEGFGFQCCCLRCLSGD